MQKVNKIGRHTVRHGDAMNVPEILELMAGHPKADIFYSDPPWGDGNLKYWQTMNMNGADATPPDTFDSAKFMAQYMKYAAMFTDGFVVIEYGDRWAEMVKQAAMSAGLHFCAQVSQVYGSANNSVTVMVFHTAAPQPIDLSPLKNAKGYKAVIGMFKILLPKLNRAATIGIDLCCGMGYTAQACIDSGLIFIGNEMNAARLQKTIERLKKG